MKKMNKMSRIFYPRPTLYTSRREKVILEICEALAQRTQLELEYGLTRTFRIVCVVFITIYPTFIGGICGSLLGYPAIGTIIGAILGILVGIYVTGRLPRGIKCANEVISRELSADQKSILVGYVGNFMDERFLVDPISCLSAFSRHPRNGDVIVKQMMKFFKLEMNYRVRCYVPAYSEVHTINFS